MWSVRFTLQDKNPAGHVVFEQVWSESGFENQGQAEAWLADGAKQRFGDLFWHRCAKIEVVEGESVRFTQVDPPPFSAGGEYDNTKV